jgi:hypothetical protein
MVLAMPAIAADNSVGEIDGVQLPSASASVAVSVDKFMGFGVTGPLNSDERDAVASDCQSGGKVPTAPVVVTVGLNKIELSGRSVGIDNLDGGLVGAAQRKGKMLPDLFVPLMDVSSTSRSLARLGCAPWNVEGGTSDMPALLIAADGRVPSPTLDLVVQTATQAHFDRIGLWVQDKRPSKDPIPSAPKNAGFLLTLTDTYAAITGYSVEVFEVLPGVDLPLALDRALGAGALPVGAQVVIQVPNEWSVQQATFALDKAAEHGHACTMFSGGFGPAARAGYRGAKLTRVKVPSGKLPVLPLHVSGIGMLGEKVSGDVLVTGSQCPAARESLVEFINSKKLPGQFPFLAGATVIPDVTLPEDAGGGEDWASEWGL